MRQKGEKREELVAKMKRWINFVLIRKRAPSFYLILSHMSYSNIKAQK